jgi:hypothetical protein
LVELLDNYFNEDYLLPILDAYKVILNDAVQEDTYFDDSFGFTHQDFLSSFTLPMNNHVEYGLLEFLAIRRDSALEQLGLVLSSEQPSTHIDVYPNPSDGPAFYYNTSGVPTSPVTVTTSLGVPVNITCAQINDNTIQVNLSDPLAAGLYLIRVDGNVMKWILR